MALSRVQGTGKVTADGATTVSLTFATPPAIGNAIVVEFSYYSPGAATVQSVVDNRGNSYSAAVFRGGGGGGTAWAAIYRCALVAASSAPFTITITFATAAAWVVASAIEVSGVGTGLVLDQIASATGGPLTTLSTGATPPLTAAEALLVAAVGLTDVGQGAITVAAATPAWTEEHENLPFGPHTVGEADSRLLPAALGATPSCSWTWTGTSPSVAVVLAAFKAVAPASAALTATATLAISGMGTVTIPIGPGLVTQLAVELLDAQPPALAISQLIVETLNPLLRSPIAVTHVLTEHLDANPNQAYVTQLLCELLVIGAPDECLASHTPLPFDPD